MAHESHDTETISAAMDYAQHEATWNTFIRLGKWSIIVLAVLMVALFFFVQP
ncbi:MAG: aa3-type cytochrome c oxidase subunit IV [Hyphomicrobiales bacterium]|nr:MAG: aa3-type cytochrome c oxidase subunit IV [Hyphomicrobiales bacterium]